MLRKRSRLKGQYNWQTLYKREAREVGLFRASPWSSNLCKDPMQRQLQQIANLYPSSRRRVQKVQSKREGLGSPKSRKREGPESPKLEGQSPSLVWDSKGKYWSWLLTKEKHTNNLHWDIKGDGSLQIHSIQTKKQPKTQKPSSKTKTEGLYRALELIIFLWWKTIFSTPKTKNLRS